MSHKKPLQNQKVAFTVIDEEAALVHPVDSSLYWLNPVATRIWQLADGQNSAEEIAGQICAEFDVEYDVALADVRQMIDAFEEKALFESAEEESTAGG